LIILESISSTAMKWLFPVIFQFFGGGGAGLAQSLYWLGYGLDDRCSILGRGRNYSLRHRVQTGSGAHPAFYPKGNRGSFRELKGLGHEGHQLPPSSVEVRNAWRYTSTPADVIMAWCSVKQRIYLHGLPLPLSSSFSL